MFGLMSDWVCKYLHKKRLLVSSLSLFFSLLGFDVSISGSAVVAVDSTESVQVC